MRFSIIILLTLILFLNSAFAVFPDTDPPIETKTEMISSTDEKGEIEWKSFKIEQVEEIHTLSQNCTTDYDCNIVSVFPGLARCYQGTCVCRTENGFTGLALLTDKCKCEPPKILNWSGTFPICTPDWVKFSQCSSRSSSRNSYHTPIRMCATPHTPSYHL